MQWLVRYIVIYTLLLSLGVEVSFFETMILGWFVYFAILFIPTPGPVLGAEAAFYLIFASLLSADLIGLVTFGWRFLTFYMQLTLGIILFLSTRFYTEKNSIFLPIQWLDEAFFLELTPISGLLADPYGDFSIRPDKNACLAAKTPNFIADAIF